MSGFLGGGIGPMALKQRRAAAADWWQVAGQTCVAVYQPIGAATLAASYVNLANPGTYDAAPGVAPTLAAGGWSGNGTQYLTTGVVPAVGWSAIVRFANVIAGDACLLGSLTASGNHFWIYPTTGAGTTYVYFGYGGATKLQAPNIANGILALAGGTGYINGSAVVVGGAWSGTSQPLYIFARNGNGITQSLLSATIAAVAIYSTTLTEADVAALTTRMQALA